MCVDDLSNFRQFVHVALYKESAESQKNSFGRIFILHLRNQARYAKINIYMCG